MDLNKCDKCDLEEDTNKLIWITSEDFEPRKNERIPKTLYDKFDALCEYCYNQEIKKVV